MRNSHVLRTYNITAVEWDAMLAAQNGQCCICGITPKDVRDSKNRRHAPFHVDHDHTTGKIRSLLCFNCNQGLGQFKDNIIALRAAADYLEKHKSKSCQSHQTYAPLTFVA